MTAKIVTDSGGGPVVGSAILPGSQVNTPVLLTNLDNTGVSGWRWEIIDAPPESPTLYPLPGPVFTPSHSIANDVKGQCVLVRLTTYTDVARTILDDVDQVIIGVRFDPPFDWLIPAAGQTLESNQIRGWAQDVNEILREAHEFMEGGAGGGAPRLIENATRKIQADYATIYRDEIRLRGGGQLRVEGQLTPINMPRHFMPTRVPPRTRLIIPPNEVVHFHGVLPVQGVLTVRGLLKDITPPPLDGQEVLDALTNVAPNTPSILGVASPASFLLPAAVRAMLDVQTTEEVEDAIDAAIALIPVVDRNYDWWAVSSEPDGSFLGADIIQTGTFNASVNRTHKWSGAVFAGTAFLPVTTPADHNRIVAFYEADNATAAYLTIDGNGATIRWPGSSGASVNVRGARSRVMLKWDASDGVWVMQEGFDHILGGDSELLTTTSGTRTRLQLPNDVLVGTPDIGPANIGARYYFNVHSFLWAGGGSRIISPASLGPGTYNNYTPSGWNGAVFASIGISSGQPRITGFGGVLGASPLKYVKCATTVGLEAAEWLVLEHNSGSSAYPIWTPNQRDLILRYGQGAWMYFDGGVWHVVATQDEGQDAVVVDGFQPAFPITLYGRAPNHYITLSQVGHTVDIVGSLPGKRGLIQIQQGLGGQTITSWLLDGAAVAKYPGGTPPVLSVTAGAVDTVEWFNDGSNLYVRLHAAAWA